MSEIPVPTCITEKLWKLNQLTERYPENIPVSAIADFLGCDGESVRSYLMVPGNAFGMGWLKQQRTSRGFFVPTAKFYLWYRNLVEIRKGA